MSCGFRFRFASLKMTRAGAFWLLVLNQMAVGVFGVIDYSQVVPYEKAPMRLLPNNHKRVSFSIGKVGSFPIAFWCLL